MTISHLLEDFSGYAKGKPVSLTDVTLEEKRLEAFEKGYQAGWDDSAKAASDDTRRISADFAQNIQDLSFTYQEAYSAVLGSLKPLLEQMMTTLLPAMLRQTLGAQITEQIHALTAEQGPQPIELVTHPDNAASLEDLRNTDVPSEIKIIEEPTLSEGQVFLRFGQQEREIDLTGVLSMIEQKVSGFFEENQKDIA